MGGLVVLSGLCAFGRHEGGEGVGEGDLRCLPLPKGGFRCLFFIILILFLRANARNMIPVHGRLHACLHAYLHACLYARAQSNQTGVHNAKGYIKMPNSRLCVEFSRLCAEFSGLRMEFIKIIIGELCTSQCVSQNIYQYFSFREIHCYNNAADGIAQFAMQMHRKVQILA